METQNPTGQIEEQVKQTTPIEAVEGTISPNTPQPKNQKLGMILAGAFIFSVIVLILISRVLAMRNNADQNNTPTPTGTIPTKKSVQPIATESAFIQLTTAVASVSSRLTGFDPFDPKIVPPVVELPLGFSK
jgi:hypothetical protein